MADKTATYEGLFIFDANRYARDRDALAKEVEAAITEAGGKVEVSRLWEERRLAYPINGQRKGAYWLIYFELPTQKVGELTRVCELNDSILRQLFVRLPDALVEPILEHVRGGGEPTIASEEGEPAEAAAAE
ncbi:MAG: 30S ribosomal protein S6 [Lacipirellulaceae bacterium]